jgi:hypothetical protein
MMVDIAYVYQNSWYQVYKMKGNNLCHYKKMSNVIPHIIINNNNNSNDKVK